MLSGFLSCILSLLTKPKLSGLGWLSKFLTRFAFLIGVWMTLFVTLAKLLPIGFPVWTELKSFPASLVMWSSTLFSPSPLLPLFALAMWGISTSLSICHLSRTRHLGAIHPPLVVDDVHLFLWFVSYFSDT